MGHLGLPELLRLHALTCLRLVFAIGKKIERLQYKPVNNFFFYLEFHFYIKNTDGQIFSFPLFSFVVFTLESCLYRHVNFFFLTLNNFQYHTVRNILFMAKTEFEKVKSLLLCKICGF